MGTYTIPIDRLSVLTELVEKQTARAKRRGVEFSVTIDEIADTRRLVDGYLVADYRVDGIGFVIDGYAFIATLQHNPAGNVIRRFPDHNDTVIPAEYYTRDCICDHCGTKRRRNDTILIRNIATRQFMTIGRNCLRDFIGYENPETVADTLLKLRDMVETATQLVESEDYPTRSKYSYLLPVLECTAISIRLRGWVSRQMALTTGISGTLNHVHCILEKLPFDVKFTAEELRLTESDIETANNAVAWVLNSTDNSDYMHNLRVIYSDRLVHDKNLGIAVSGVAAYLRHVDNLKRFELQRNAASNVFVGTVNQRLTLSGLTVASTRKFTNDFGISTLIIFKTATNETIKWFCSSDIDIADGTIVKQLVGTVKTHETYNGLNSTVLTRCKMTID